MSKTAKELEQDYRDAVDDAWAAVDAAWVAAAAADAAGAAHASDAAVITAYKLWQDALKKEEKT